MKASDIKKVACYAAGTIGSSFAAYFALKGLPCAIYIQPDPERPDRLERGQSATMKIIDSMAGFGIIKPEEAPAVKARITVTSDPEQAFADCQFIQENGPENYDCKRDALKLISEYAPPDAIVATSTSGLLITEMAKLSKYPDRCIGAHPFNPPHLIPLIEITKGEMTSQETIDAAAQFYKSIGKEPIVLRKEKLGFVANRLAHALWREEIALVSEGVVTLEECDKAVCYGPGLRWAIYGPAMNYELGGGELGLRGSGIKFGAMTNMVFEDISDMKRVPESWDEISGVQITAQKENMPDFMGHNNEELKNFRDQMLIDILKLHRKL